MIIIRSMGMIIILIVYCHFFSEEGYLAEVLHLPDHKQWYFWAFSPADSFRSAPHLFFSLVIFFSLPQDRFKLLATSNHHPNQMAARAQLTLTLSLSLSLSPVIKCCSHLKWSSERERRARLRERMRGHRLMMIII
jgi:hypothetical protein